MTEPDQIICACFDVTLSRMRRAIADDPSMTFDDLMGSTGAGTKCTACLLDLEYFFVSGERPGGRSQIGKRTRNRSFKRRIYDLVDSLSPARPHFRRGVAPVISGKGIEEYFWIANAPMLFGDEFPATPHRYRYAVRDGNGNVRASAEAPLPPGRAERINISGPINDGAVPFSVGTFEIALWAERRGFIGTTRPQIEILTAAASCSVHLHSPIARPFKGGVSVPCSPDDERIFLVFMNPFDRALTGRITITDHDRSHDISATPFGTAPFEVPTRQVGADFAFVQWDMHSGCKVYMICASAGLDRFSVDHV